MFTNRRTLILCCVFIIVFIVCLIEAVDVESKEKSEIREITIVTITPERTPEPEPINFDLRNLAIVKKDKEDDISGTEISGRDSKESGADSEESGADIEGTGGNEEGDPFAEASGDGIPGSGDTGLCDTDSGDTVERDTTNGDGRESGGSDLPELVGEGSNDPAEEGQNLTYLGAYTATAYCACSICTGEYATGYTASGTLATEGRTVACNTLPFGTEIYIEGYGYYIVEDTGWSPYGDAWLDIFFESHDSALAFGLRNVEVYLVN